jgi:hypothetical protein
MSRVNSKAYLVAAQPRALHCPFSLGCLDYSYAPQWVYSRVQKSFSAMAPTGLPQLYVCTQSGPEAFLMLVRLFGLGTLVSILAQSDQSPLT